ncbi:UNVERIFIED_CONTAM: hypothetical protein K2H54_017321 [Gekko kuhli]
MPRIASTPLNKKGKLKQCPSPHDALVSRSAPNSARMKVFALGILLVSLYCTEGAVVKREAEGQPPESPAEVAPFLSQYFPGLADYFQRETFTDYASKAQAFFQQVHERILNEQVAERIGQAFTTALESAKKAMQ